MISGDLKKAQMELSTINRFVRTVEKRVRDREGY